MVYESKKYDSDKYPHVRTPNPTKEDDYYLQNVEAIYSAYIRGRTAITFAETYTYYSLRAFGDGRQPEERYKNYFTQTELPTPADPANFSGVDQGGSRESKRKGYFNVLWDIVSPASKITSTLIGNFLNHEYDVVADAVDPFSRNSMEDEKIALWVEKENMEWYKQIYSQIGLDYKPPEFIPETVEELELYEMSGGFKPNYAKIMEKFTKHTLDISDWHDEIKKRLLRDLIDIAVIGVRDYYCEVDHKVKTKYIDPRYAVIQHSRYADFHDSEFAGEFREITISELVERGIPREKLSVLAHDYSGFEGNPTVDQWDEFAEEVEAGIWGYDFYKVCEFDAEWIDNEEKTVLYHTNRYGNTTTKDVDYGYSRKLTANQKIKKTNRRFRYASKWVVGTDIYYDQGKCHDITRPTKKDASLTFHFYKLRTRSITKQLIPLYDNYQIIWLKYQAAIGAAVNKGYAINVDSLANIKTKEGKADKQEGVKRFLESGILFHKETNPSGYKNVTFKPVEDLPGGMGSFFTEIVGAFQLNTRMIEDITGLNPVALGSTPDPNAPVGTTELAVGSMTATLKPLLSGYLKVKSETAQNVCRWIQLGLRHNKDMYDAYEAVFGKFEVQTLKEAEGDGVTYGINLEARPTSLEKKDLYESAKISLAAGRDGRPGIDEADYFAIVRMIENGGSLLFAETILANRIRKARLEHRKAEQDNQAMNAQIQQQAQQQKTKDETDGKLLDHDLAVKLEAVKHQHRLEEIRLQEGTRVVKDVSVAEIKTTDKQEKQSAETAT